MSNTSSFSWKARAASFKFAWRGIIALWSEHNARIHSAVAVLVLILSACLHLSAAEWIAVVACIALVFAAEAFNSAIEALADKVSRDKHPLIARAKDMAAGAVLIVVIGAVIIGLILFVPKIVALSGFIN